MTFRQASWKEPLIFELSKIGKSGILEWKPEEEITKTVGDPTRLVPAALRGERPKLPEVSEVEVVRHYTRLSQENYAVDLGIYPLGSCSMKYNPKICDVIANSPKIQNLHPYQDEAHAQGILKILYDLSLQLVEITGMHKFSLQPSAGAHGELAGALIIRAYHASKKALNLKDEMIVPDSAHGTNPASATMAGFKTVVVPSDSEGCVNIDALRATLTERTAGLMLTNPNTLGVFERNILRISKMVHKAGGLLYYDGANLNALLGKTRPGDMGFDIVHVNIHKTFATPHGGGGPGAGPIGVREELEQFLPVPTVESNGNRYFLDYDRPHSIGKVKGFYGNVSVLVRAYAYLLCLGAEGLEEVANLSVLNANYLAKKISNVRGYSVPYAKGVPRKHELVASAETMKRETGVRALDISKRLLDYGVHAPTIYFPHTVSEALMIEPTETESKKELDKLVNAFAETSKEAYCEKATVIEAPHNTSVGRINEVAASHPRTMCLSWKMYREREDNR